MSGAVRGPGGTGGCGIVCGGLTARPTVRQETVNEQRKPVRLRV